jgi:xanthine dehydrogenase accessory factor
MHRADPTHYIEAFAELAQSGQAFVSVTMVDAIGSVPQEIGSKMLVNPSGLVYGTVGGGRVENQAIEHAKQLMAAPANHCTSLFVEWNLKRDVGMTCGGTVKFLIECLLKLDCKIEVIDPREAWVGKLPSSPKLVKHILAEPETYVASIPDQAYVLLMTMGHRTDLPVLEAILKSGRTFPYLGVIGSKGKKGALRKELLSMGLSTECVDSFRCPIGLPIGSNQPAEIAISVAAELLQVRDQQRANQST